MKIPLGPAARIGYLSAAPRVSTRDDAEASGPRSHVLGVIGAFEATGAQVERFIVGDRMPTVVRARSERALRSSRWRRLAADTTRLGLGVVNARRAWHELGNRVDWVYERAASLQALGWTFQQRGTPWILETSSPVFYEAKHERRAMVLDGIAERLELAAYQRCSAIVAVSDDLKDILVDVGIPARKIVVVPNGVDTARFDPDRYRDAPRTFPGFTIGFVGAVIAWQGLDLLLDAVAAVRARGVDVALAIAGDGPERAVLEDRARKLAIATHVRFVGRLRGSEVPRFLAGVDLGFSGQTLLRIGKMYHSPLKLYEYMAMGKPVIASDFADARATVIDARTGFLFRAGDRAELERAIHAAHAARLHLAELGMEARAHAIANHSWRSRVATMHAALEEL